MWEKGQLVVKGSEGGNALGKRGGLPEAISASERVLIDMTVC